MREMADAVTGPAADPDHLIALMRDLSPRFRERAPEAEQLRTLPAESSADLLQSEIARVLVPRRWGGFELGLDTWFDLVREVARADASHGWCAGLLIHTAHMIAYFPEEAQAAVWADSANVAVTGSVMPVCQVESVDGGYRISGHSPFSSGVGHCSWVYVAGMRHGPDGPVWTLFLVAPGEYEVLDTWHTTGMRGTGSNTIVTADTFVPAGHILALSDLVNGSAPGSEVHENPMYGLPFISYAPIGFAGTMLGAAQGALESFIEWVTGRTTAAHVAMSTLPNVQVRMARAAADLDAAELLLQRTIETAQRPETPSLELRARGMRDYARSSELITGAIDTLVALCGTAGYAESSPIQRAWRDIHFASCHISLNPEVNFGHWGATQLGIERPPTMALY
jgi:3-hydroxy-9,10-secoandrosta-1,3,5(10)-triene-9,17-dione monooxygenase